MKKIFLIFSIVILIFLFNNFVFAEELESESIGENNNQEFERFVVNESNISEEENFDESELIYEEGMQDDGWVTDEEVQEDEGWIEAEEVQEDDGWLEEQEMQEDSGITDVEETNKPINQTTKVSNESTSNDMENNKIPYTGKQEIIMIIIIAMIVNSIVMFYKIRSMKNIQKL